MSQVSLKNYTNSDANIQNIEPSQDKYSYQDEVFCLSKTAELSVSLMSLE